MSQSWSVLTFQRRLTQSTMAYYSNGCSPSSALHEHRRPGSSPTSGLDPVCQAESVTSRGARGQRCAGVCARASVVYRLLQPGRRWDVITEHGVHGHLYTDDTQLHLAMSVDNTAAGLSILAAHSNDIRQWYLQNGLQLNPDKSEVLIVDIANQLCVADSSSSSVYTIRCRYGSSGGWRCWVLSSNGMWRFTNTSRWLLGCATIACRPSVTSNILYRWS